MSETVAKRPKSVLLVGLLILGYALYVVYCLSNEMAVYDPELLQAYSLIGGPLKLLSPTTLLPLLFLLLLLLLVSSLSLITFKSWSRKFTLVAIYLFVGTEIFFGLLVKGDFNKTPYYLFLILVFLLLLKYFNSTSIKAAFPPDGVSLIISFVLIASLFIAVYLSAWFYLGGNKLPSVTEAHLTVKTGPINMTRVVLPDRFTISVPEKYIIKYVYGFHDDGTLILGNQSNSEGVTLNEHSLAHAIYRNFGLLNFTEPAAFAKRYFNDRYTLSLLILKIYGTHENSSIRHITYKGMEMYEEIWHNDKSYFAEVWIFRDGKDFGDIYVWDKDKTEPFESFEARVDTMLATISTPGESHPADYYYKSGMKYMAENKLEKAKFDLASALLSDWDNTEYHYQTAIAFRNSGNIKAAQYQLKETLKLDPDNEKVKKLLDEFEPLSKTDED